MQSANCKACGRYHQWPDSLPAEVVCNCGHVVSTPSLASQVWIRWVKLLSNPSDKGVGDTVQRIAAKFGGERFKAFAAKIGMPCGCTERQSEWNERWPY